MHESTLFIRHFSKDFTVEDKVNFLQQYGATAVRCMPNYGKMRYSAFASFPTKELAECALQRLHQLELAGQRLVVQFAKPQQSVNFPHESDFTGHRFIAQNEAGNLENEKERITNKISEFTKQLNAIAPHLGVNYPPSPLLRYKYPPPTPSIIANISSALASVPKFYTQVLHLMNKMNMPAPFGQPTPTPPLLPDPPVITANDKVIVMGPRKGLEDQISSEESEYQSEEDETPRDTMISEPRTKRPATKKPLKPIKRPKLQKIITPVASQTQTRDADKVIEPSKVFETVELESKKIQFNFKQGEELVIGKSNEEDSSEISVVESGGFGVIEPQKIETKEKEETSDNEEMWKGVQFLSNLELERNKISAQEMKNHTAFKNYAPGEATYRLYVKNLANQVDDKDLISIFGRYINRRDESEKNMFDIRLMEGRMKGQAFVTLANEEQAIKAVNETHGFMLKGKPIVVQFARSARPKEDANSGKAKKK